ncbi:unnamed protein product, partial [marine sediment metagenome]
LKNTPPENKGDIEFLNEELNRINQIKETLS